MLIDKSKMLDVRESHFIWQVNKFVNGTVNVPERNNARQSIQKFMIFLVVKLLRAHEGCLGTGRR